MAKNHIEAGNLQSGLILIGAVIEKHLRNLCLAGNINTTNQQLGSATPKKPLQLTGEAYKKKLYDRQQHKKIITWLEICGNAALNSISDISVEQVQDMHADVSRFLADTPY